MSIELSDTHRANLRKLADGLRKHAFPAKFDMAVYAEDEFGINPVCGTVGCAVGCATYIVEPKVKNDDGNFESYNKYAERVFGTSPFIDDGLFDWCFCCSWRHVDNTPEGAAARIEMLLRGELDQVENLAQYVKEICYDDSPLPYTVGGES